MITATESAISKITQQLQKRKKGLGVRIGVKTTGCSGLAYTLEFVDIPENTDHVVTYDTCNIYVNPKSMPYLNGMMIDYVKQGLNEGFEFKNPNERDRCGCGESFRV